MTGEDPLGNRYRPVVVVKTIRGWGWERGRKVD